MDIEQNNLLKKIEDCHLYILLIIFLIFSYHPEFNQKVHGIVIFLFFFFFFLFFFFFFFCDKLTLSNLSFLFLLDY